MIWQAESELLISVPCGCMHRFIFCHGPGITSQLSEAIPALLWPTWPIFLPWTLSQDLGLIQSWEEVRAGCVWHPLRALLHPLPCSLQAHQCWLHCLLPVLKTPAIEWGRSVRLSSPCSLQHRTVPYSTLFTRAMIYTAHHDYQLAPTTFKLFFWPGRASLPAYYFWC